MRRYSIRFLVALLTFLLGVALSFVFGAVKGIRYLQTYTSNCSRQISAKEITPALPVIDAEPYEPLQLVHLRTTRHPANPRLSQVHVLIRNRSEQTISEYVVGSAGRSRNALSFIDEESPLGSGEARTVTFSSRVDTPLILRVEMVKFEDGSVWKNHHPPE